MTKITKRDVEAKSAVEKTQQARQPERAAGATKTGTAPAPATADKFRASATAPQRIVEETKMDIVCPLMGALVNAGHVKLDKDGRMKTTDFASAVYKNVGVTRTFAAGVLLSAPMANKPSDILGNVVGMRFNPLKMRSGLIKHPNDSMILEHGRFDEQKFQALVSHAEGGRMTTKSFANAISATIGRDQTDKGTKLAFAEAAAILNLFGAQNAKTGERSIDVDVLRNLYEHKQLPPADLMMSRPRSGLGDLKTTMARMAQAMPMGTAAGDSAEGVRRSLGQSSTVGANAVVGAGKARCPHMQGASPKPPPTGVDDVGKLHDQR